MLRRNKATDWKKVLESAKSGNLIDIPEDIQIRYYGNLTRIAKDNARPRFRQGIECHVLYGPTGTGKSYLAFQKAGEMCYVKNPNVKWWDGYRGEECIVVDEFAGRIDITYLLRWIDEYPCMVENKGGALPLAATKFFITSNMHPDLWYPEAAEAHKRALSRRLTSITLMDTPYVPPSSPKHRQHPVLALDSGDSDWEWALENHPF